MALLDYLSARRAEIEAQMKALKGELAEIRVAEAALNGAPTGRTAVSGPQGGGVVREGSIKDWVLKALSTYQGGMTTDGVRAAVAGLGGPDVPRNSMTPQLSRLKAAALIELDGRLWRLAANDPFMFENEETPDGYQPSGASEEAEDFHGL